MKKTLKLHGLSISKFDLPNISTHLISGINLHGCESNPPPCNLDYDSHVETVNTEQRSFINEVIDLIESNTSDAFFIDGPGGSGKTYIYKCLITYCSAKNLTVYPSPMHLLSMVLVAQEKLTFINALSPTVPLKI